MDILESFPIIPNQYGRRGKSCEIPFASSTCGTEVKTLVDCHSHWISGLLDSEVGISQLS